jgi:NAD(P)H-hydrate repair Nnr-like enzyme with NAD(P)H-hydrate dehydratase domain
MLLICGTVPYENIALIKGEAKFDRDKLFIQDTEIPCTQGTAALVSAACVTAAHLRQSPPHVVLAGDTGSGKGSRLLYDYLIKNLAPIKPDILLMHYILPVMGLMKKVCDAAAKCAKKPVMIADASSMYAAKAAGLAPIFDIFTPDLCEMAFLADADAVHPAYISRHLFSTEIAQVQELIAAAYKQKNAAKTLIIKGAIDHVAEDGKIICTISEPDIPAMEAIGGTGDTISGMVGAFIDAGWKHREAAIAVLKANREAGKYAQAAPATKIRQIVQAIPHVLKNYVREEVLYD